MNDPKPSLGLDMVVLTRQLLDDAGTLLSLRLRASTRSTSLQHAGPATHCVRSSPTTMPVDVRSTSCEVLAAKRIVSGQIAHMAVEEGRAGVFRYVRLWRMGRVSRQVGATSVTSWMQAETLNDAETLCGTTFYPEQKMKILGNPDSFSLRQRVSNLGPLTVGEIAFGTDVRLDCGELHDSYHVNIPISGHTPGCPSTRPGWRGSRPRCGHCPTSNARRP
jgi:hypothetical protein